MNCSVGFLPWNSGYNGYWTMPYNIYTNPYISYGIGNGYSCNYATAMGMAAGNRDILKICYSSLLKNLTDIQGTISNYESNKNATENEKKQYNELKMQALALLQEVQRYGQNSTNTLIFSATNDIHKYEKQFYQLRDAAAAINKAVVARTKTTTTQPSTPTSETTNTGGTTETTETTETTTPGGTSEVVTADTIKQQYESEVKQNLTEIINDPDITAEDKKALQEKQKELEDAIKENKPVDELQRIYNELTGLMVEVLERIEAAENNNNAQELQQLTQKSNELIKKIRDYSKNNQKYTDKADRVKLSEKITELQTAIANNKSKDEINKVYQELNSLYLKIKSSSDKLIEQADGICGAILNASNGMDWNWPWAGDTENEKIIKASVNKINATNVRAVLNRWNDVYKAPSDDSCLLETLYAEFKTDSATKKALTAHIAKAIGDYAKSKGAYDKVGGYLNIIQGNSSYSEKYRAFNKIIDELNKMA